MLRYSLSVDGCVSLCDFLKLFFKNPLSLFCINICVTNFKNKSCARLDKTCKS